MVKGNDLTIDFAAGSLRRDDGCGKNYTKTIPAVRNSFKWQIQKDEYGIVSLCLKQKNGETLCYRKVEL